MANVSYWEEYDIIHNNKGMSIDVINSKLDRLYGESSSDESKKVKEKSF